MKVILTKDVPSLGRAGDVKEVSDGHARNFLIAKHLALPATSQMLAKVQKEELEHQAKVKRETERFLSLKNKLENQTIVLKGKATKNNLFAAIHEKDIALAISERFGVEIGPDMVRVSKPVKSLGLHEIEIRFAKNLSAKVKLNIESE